MTTLLSLTRAAVGLAVVAVGVVVFFVLCLPLLPWRSARIRVCNVFGHIVGWSILKVSGARVPPGRRDLAD